MADCAGQKSRETSLGSRIAAIEAVGYSPVMGASAASLSVMFTTSPEVALLFSGGSDHGKWLVGTSAPYWRDIGPEPPPGASVCCDFDVET